MENFKLDYERLHCNEVKDFQHFSHLRCLLGKNKFSLVFLVDLSMIPGKVHSSSLADVFWHNFSSPFPIGLSLLYSWNQRVLLLSNNKIKILASAVLVTTITASSSIVLLKSPWPTNNEGTNLAFLQPHHRRLLYYDKLPCPIPTRLENQCFSTLCPSALALHFDAAFGTKLHPSWLSAGVLWRLLSRRGFRDKPPLFSHCGGCNLQIRAKNFLSSTIK